MNAQRFGIVLLVTADVIFCTFIPSPWSFIVAGCAIVGGYLIDEG